MSSPFVVVGPPPRGEGSQDPVEFYAQAMRATFSWGSTPGTATIVYVGAAPITAGALCNIQIGGMKMVGVCQSDVEDKGSGGQLRTLQFVDLRHYLTWDWVCCAFNKSVVRIVNGVRKKYYWHIYPEDFDAGIKTFTNEPLLGHQILTAIFSAPTIGSPWSWDLTSAGQFPAGLMNEPVYNFDALGGKRLDAALNEISERLGLVFSLESSDFDFPYKLVWTRKGYGTLGSFPSNSDDRRLGTALSGHATNIRVLGGRNRYQLLNLEMEPDWSAAWEQFLVPDELVWDIYANEANAEDVDYDSYPGDTDHWTGYGDAKVRAMEITVREYVALRNERSAGTGNAFADERKFAGRSRMDMPAWLYIETILRRAFRPAITHLNNIDDAAIPLESLDISDQMVCKVFLDYATGAMTHDPASPVDGNGLLAVKGYQVGEDLFRMAQPDRISASFFDAATRGWGTCAFQSDDSGEGVRFVITESPVFVGSTVAGKELLKTVDGYAVLNAAFELATPAVSAALTFEAERYSYWAGTYPDVSRDHVENVDELQMEFSDQGAGWVEVPYADGNYADDKADEIATALLQRQYWYYAGGYELKWKPTEAMSSFGAQLTSLQDRVDIENSPAGLKARVDFTTERGRDNFEPERELDRKSVQAGLFPGQMELRAQAEAQKRLNAGIRQTQRAGLMPSFQKFLRGEWDKPTTQVWVDGGSGTLPVGAPLTTANANKRVKPPSASATTDAFVGVTVRQNEDATKPLNVQTSGTALVRVKGPVAINDMVGLVAGQNYLEKDSTTSVGKVLEAIGDTSTKLIRVALGSGGGGGGTGMIFRGEYDGAFSGDYKQQDVVVVRTGMNKGTYVCVQDNPIAAGQSPSDGSTHWVSLIPNQTIGEWA